MQVVRASEGAFGKGDEGRFTGEVWLRSTARAPDGTDVGVVHFSPGDVIHVGPDEWHFHGGTPQTPLVHVAVNGAGAPDWGEPVTDEEYAEGF